MRARRLCCLLAVLVLIAPCALASDLQTALSRLSDEDIMRLYSMVVLEMYQRGLSPDDIISHVEQQQQAPAITHAAASTHSVDIPLQDVLEYAQNAVSSIPYTETFTTYDPPATPRPTFAPLIQIENDDTVYISKTGKRYHTTPDCSGMRTAHKVTLSEAIGRGLTPCRDCAYWLAEMGD